MKLRYQIRLELSFISVLSILILIFILFPKFEPKLEENFEVYISNIEAIQIPITYQSEQFKRPPVAKPAIPVESEETQIMDDIEVESMISEHIIGKDGLMPPIELKKLPYTPRQLYEVLPEESDEKIIGEVRLLLKIDVNGKVDEYKIIRSSISSEAYLDKVIEAALHSKWAPAVINNRPVIYWVEKSYKFR
jgi:protein TonB